MKDYSNYLFRASSLGKIMGGGRSKVDPFGKVGLKYLKECWREKSFGIKKKSMQTLAMRKGHICEAESLSLASTRYGKPLFKFNPESALNLTRVGENAVSITNGWVMGKPDSIDSEGKVVIDIKTSESIFTFDDADEESDYEWQLKAYMWILGYGNAILAYCLPDTPQELLVSYAIKAGYNHANSDEEASEIEENINQEYVYGDKLTDLQRTKFFYYTLTDLDIQKMQERITIARQYLQSLESTLLL